MTSVIAYKNVLESHASETENVLKKMLETHLFFYLPQSPDAGNIIWSFSVCAVADPGHLFLQSITGQCFKSRVGK